MATFRSAARPATIGCCLLVAASAGCHTLEGAVGGFEGSLYMLAQGGSPSGQASGELILIVLAIDPVIGAGIGAVQDLAELWAYCEDQNDIGVRWDSPAGRCLRRGGW